MVPAKSNPRPRPCPVRLESELRLDWPFPVPSASREKKYATDAVVKLANRRCLRDHRLFGGPPNGALSLPKQLLAYSNLETSPRVSTTADLWTFVGIAIPFSAQL
jgi:hypothetical protein